MESGRRIDLARFIDRLDGCFSASDWKAARDCIESRENEARELGDERGLLTVLNEAVGLYRRTKKKQRALAALEECLALVEKLGVSESLSGATITVNAATTLSFFREEEEALELYQRAERWFLSAGQTESYEYAALLNNKAATLYTLKRYREAEEDWKRAVDILKKIGGHAVDMAVSLVMLAHASFDRDDTSYERVESLLDEAWECIHAEDQPKDGNYAYALRKCAPSFDYFQRPVEAQALRDVADEIYRGGRDPGS